MKMKKTGMGLVIPKKLRIGGMTFYQDFASLANGLPVVYVERRPISHQENNNIDFSTI